MSGSLSKSARRWLIVSGLVYLAVPALQPVMTGAQINLANAEAQRQARNTSSFAVLLGEFRTSLSDLLFIKTERYLDRGVGYEPHVDSREMASSEGAGVHGAHDHDHDHDHHDHHHDHDHDHTHGDVVKTLIKTANDDFRGFIGHLEREVKPWRDPNLPHDHASGTEMSEVLPWYRLATISNPHDVRNYYIGAWWLKTLRTEKQREEAIKFLDEGIQANPSAYELYLMKGMILREMDDLQAARNSFRKSAELGIKRRPPGGAAGEKDPTWDVTNDEQLNTAVGMDVMITRDTETTAAALAVLQRYKHLMPDEPALERMSTVLAPGN